jgi:hypothetical protein
MLNVDLFSYYPNLNGNFCIIKIYSPVGEIVRKKIRIALFSTLIIKRYQSQISHLFYKN